MSEPAPGPWKHSCFLVTDAKGGRVCHTGMGNRPPSESHTSEANARLIAAAPELLEALKAARAELEAFESEVTGESYNNLALNAAIAKAEGRS